MNERRERGAYLTQSLSTGVIRLRINPIVLPVIELRKKREIDNHPTVSEGQTVGNLSVSSCKQATLRT